MRPTVAVAPHVSLVRNELVERVLECRARDAVFLMRSWCPWGPLDPDRQQLPPGDLSVPGSSEVTDRGIDAHDPMWNLHDCQ